MQEGFGGARVGSRDRGRNGVERHRETVRRPVGARERDEQPEVTVPVGLRDERREVGVAERCRDGHASGVGDVDGAVGRARGAVGVGRNGVPTNEGKEDTFGHGRPPNGKERRKTVGRRVRRTTQA